MMKILINHCFDWESFHFIDTFLSLSYQVFGLNDKKVKMSEHIAMYFARNSLFSQKDTILNEKAFDIAIVFDDISLLQQISAKKKFLITDDHVEAIFPITIIQKPLLYGEWMEMDEEGLYIRDEYILFSDQTFQNNAIYIRTFVQLIISMFVQNKLPDKLQIYPYRSTKRSKSGVFLLEKEDQTSILAQVVRHYKKHSSILKNDLH